MPKSRKVIDEDDIDNDPMFATDEAGKNRAKNNRLTLFVERIERLEEEIKGISDDRKDVYSELKAVGYDPKIVRQIIRLRKMNPDDRQEMETLLEIYKDECGLS